MQFSLTAQGMYGLQHRNAHFRALLYHQVHLLALEQPLTDDKLRAGLWRHRELCDYFHGNIAARAGNLGRIESAAAVKQLNFSTNREPEHLLHMAGFIIIQLHRRASYNFV